MNRVCRPVCDEDTCAETATCIGRQHQPECNCPVGTRGNPFIECSRVESPVEHEPECRSDSDCSSGLACINSICSNPCAISNICNQDQECRVVDSLPLRTIMCQCPPDTIVDSSGRCVAIVTIQAQCKTDNDCKNPEQCIRGTCIEACQVNHCGVNALCKSFDHGAICYCAPGYTGNAHVECSNIPKNPIEVLPPECYNDNDCTYDKACRNEMCVNPCRVSNTCASNAFCSVTNHQPICRCPLGYEGNPRVECIARK